MRKGTMELLKNRKTLRDAPLLAAAVLAFLIVFLGPGVNLSIGRCTPLNAMPTQEKQKPSTEQVENRKQIQKIAKTAFELFNNIASRFVPKPPTVPSSTQEAVKRSESSLPKSVAAGTIRKPTNTPLGMIAGNEFSGEQDHPAESPGAESDSIFREINAPSDSPRVLATKAVTITATFLLIVGLLKLCLYLNNITHGNYAGRLQMLGGISITLSVVLSAVFVFLTPNHW